VSEGLAILGLCGSLRRGSHNRALLLAALSMLPGGASGSVWEGLKAVPPFDADDEGDPGEAVLSLRAAIAAADGLLVATPEFNGSVPGVLKNAIDWASRPVSAPALRDKPALVISASPSAFGAVWAQAEARKALRFAGARTLEEGLAVPLVAEAFTSDGSLAAPEQRDALEALLGDLVAAAIEHKAARAGG
jgi:chromate reductase